MPSAVLTATAEHDAVMKAHEIAVVKMLMAADKPDHVHPMMLATIRAVGTMALEFIRKDGDRENIAVLLMSLEKDCRVMLRALLDAATTDGASGDDANG